MNDQQLKMNIDIKQTVPIESEEGNQVFLNQIYTEIHIVKGTAAEVNKEHEIRRIEIASRNQSRAEHKIKVQDIFNPYPVTNIVYF